MSLNTGGVPWLPSRRAHRIKNLIKRHRYDIVALQEVFAPWDAKRVRPSGYCTTRGKFLSGLVILSRVRPLEVKRFTYKATTWAKGDFLARKGALMCRFEWGWLVTTHLDAGGGEADTNARGKQLARLTRKLPPGALLLAGDLNLDTRRTADEMMLAAFQIETDLKVTRRDNLDLLMSRGIATRGAAVRRETNLSDKHHAMELSIDTGVV